MRERTAWVAVLLPMTLLTVPGMLTGRAPLEGDLLVYQLPMYEVLGDAARAGRFPWWDPTVQSGTPFFANPQSQLLWPATWIHALLPHGSALMLWLLVHGLLAAAGALVWLRSKGAPPMAAALGAVIFSLGGPALSLVTKPDKLPAFALIPWLLWGLQLWAAGRRRRAFAVMVAAQVGMAFSGGLEIWILALGGASCLAVFEPERRRLPVLMGSTLLAFLIAGPQLVPFLELMPHSTRASGLDYAAAAKWSLRLADLPEFVLPWLAMRDGVPVRFLANIGVGTVGFSALVAWAWPGADRGSRGETRAVLVAGIGFLLLALGDATPVHRIAYELLPPLKSLRYPEKYLWGAWPFVALAVARGASRPAIATRSWVVGLAVLEWAVMASFLLPLVNVETVVHQGTPRGEPVPRYFNVDRHADKRTPLPPRTTAEQRLVDVSARAWPNVGVLRGADGRRRFEYADGVRAIRLARQDLYFAELIAQSTASSVLLLKRAGVEALGFLSPARLQEWSSSAAPGSSVRFVEPHTVVAVPAFRRVGWARSAELVDGGAAAFRALGEADLLQRRAIVLERGSPGVKEATNESSEGASSPPELQVERPRPERFEIELPGVGGWIVVREAWAPGWSAEVEVGGKVRPLPVARADFYLQAVPVPLVEGGETVRIRLTYRPSGMGVGLMFVVLGLLGFLAALAALGRSRGGVPAPSLDQVEIPA